MARTARPAPKTTSSRSNPIRFILRTGAGAPRSRVTSRGFTLIEIILVLGIISMVMAIGLPAISKVTGQRISSTTRRFVGMVRTIRTDAILLNSIYRLAVDMEHNTYWVESQREFKLLTSADQFTAPKKKGDKSQPPPSNFQMADKYSKKPVELPGGVRFEGVFKEREGLIKEGIAYIHFFPNGFNDQAILYLGRDGQPGKGYSLVIRPTSGRVDIVPGVVQSLEAVTQQ